MWSLLPRSYQVLIIGGSSIVVAWGLEAIWLWLIGETPSMLRVLSLTLSIVSGLLVGLAGVAWRPIWGLSPWIQRKTFPDLNGVWEGKLISDYAREGSERPIPPIKTAITVRQNLFSVSVKLQTGESTSYSTRCLLEADHKAGRFRIWYSYDNQPKAKLAYRSSRHEGIAWLEMDFDDDPNRLVGIYYTERKTRGDIDVIRRLGKLVDGLS